MNTTAFLAEVADVLDDPNARTYRAEEIVRHGDRQLRGLYRTLVEANKQFSNYTMAIQKEVALEPMDNVFDYRLPSWVQAVVAVWLRTGSPAVESTFNMYAWTAGGAQRGLLIPKGGQDGRPQWKWQGSNTLRLTGYGEAQELVLEVVVRPAHMFKGKIATVNPSASKLYLPAPVYGTVELEEGAYINSDWQVTATGVTSATQLGDVRRCVYSNAATIVTGVRHHELTMDSAFTTALAQDDTIETVLPLPDEHTRLLVLLTARACMQKKASMKGLEATMSETAVESQRFAQYATPPRDTQGPTEWKRASPNAQRPGWNGWGWQRYFGGS